MKRTVYLTEQEMTSLLTEVMNELSNVAKLRRRMNSDSSGLDNPFMSSPDKYNPQNPRHKRGFDILRDWVNYACRNAGYNVDDVSMIMTNNPLQRVHDQNSINKLLGSYRKVFTYCVNTMKLRPGVVQDIANCIGEDLMYGMLNQN